MRTLIFATIFLSLNVHGEEKSAFEQALDSAPQYQTKEQAVLYGGAEYREVEYRGETYYIQFLQRGKELWGELECTTPKGKPNHVDPEVHTVAHTKPFVTFLQDSCKRTPNGKTRLDVSFNSEMGLVPPKNK